MRAGVRPVRRTALALGARARRAGARTTKRPSCWSDCGAIVPTARWRRTPPIAWPSERWRRRITSRRAALAGEIAAVDPPAKILPEALYLEGQIGAGARGSGPRSRRRWSDWCASVPDSPLVLGGQILAGRGQLSAARIRPGAARNLPDSRTNRRPHGKMAGDDSAAAGPIAGPAKPLGRGAGNRRADRRRPIPISPSSTKPTTSSAGRWPARASSPPPARPMAG